MLLHGSKEAKMPSFITIAICGSYIHKMTGLISAHTSVRSSVRPQKMFPV